MKKHLQTLILALFIVFAFVPALAFSQSENSNSYRLYFLGGQSNMDGYGFVDDLPDSLNTTINDVWIFHGNPVNDEAENGGLGIWSVLKPGHGVGFSSDGNTNSYSNRFGPELSFVKTLQALYPDENIAIIKYSKGGSSIDMEAADQFGSWDPDYEGSTGINQYDHFLTTMRHAFSNRDIDGDGLDDHLIPSGIIWMQGESDAVFTEEIAFRYYSNLSRLLELISASLHTDDLPIVIGKISDSWNSESGKVWTHGELIQYAQEKYAREHDNAAIVRSTRFYNYSDPWHYDSFGYLDLGEEFAKAMAILLSW